MTLERKAIFADAADFFPGLLKAAPPSYFNLWEEEEEEAEAEVEERRRRRSLRYLHRCYITQEFSVETRKVEFWLVAIAADLCVVVAAADIVMLP